MSSSHIPATSPKCFSFAQTISFILIFSLALIWGINWPLMKIILNNIPPFWLAFFRFLTATLFLFPFLLLTKNLRLPARADIPIILSIACLQMVGFTIFSMLGLSHVDTGRSVILTYTTPLWVTPLALIIFKERMPFLKLIGFLMGIAGVLVLFNPLSFNWHNHEVLIGNGFLILAAWCWAICMIHARATRWCLTPLQLLLWQFIIATVLSFFFAEIFEPQPHIHWTLHTLDLLFYIGVLATGFGYWAMIEISRRLPSITTSLCMLSVPVIGLISSKIILVNAIGLVNCIAIVLIIGGLACVVQSGRNNALVENTSKRFQV